MATLSGIAQETAMKTYNQYVWVPVPEFNKFVKKDYKTGTLETFANINDYHVGNIEEANEYQKMLASVEKYGGFYIGRYESGKPSGTINAGAIEGEELSKPLIIKDATVWNLEFDNTWVYGDTGDYPYGSWNGPGAAKVVHNMYDADVKSHLPYGVEWDAAIEFISKTDPDYAVETTGKGNYTENLVSTGYHEVNNIYDMAGNVCEWTMETYNMGSFRLRIARGGYAQLFEYASIEPASARSEYPASNAGVNNGFRVALYIK